jgi:hypothetical protein
MLVFLAALVIIYNHRLHAQPVQLYRLNAQCVMVLIAARNVIAVSTWQQVLHA